MDRGPSACRPISQTQESGTNKDEPLTDLALYLRRRIVRSLCLFGPRLPWPIRRATATSTRFSPATRSRVSLNSPFATSTSPFSTTPLAPAPMAAARSTGTSCIATSMRLPVSSSTKSRSGLPARHATSNPVLLVSIRLGATIISLCRFPDSARQPADRCKSTTI